MGVADRDHEAGLPVAHRLGHAPGIRRHDGFAQSHRLERDEWEALARGRERDDVGGGKEWTRVVAPAHEMHPVAERELVGESLEGRPLGTIAGKDKRGVLELGQRAQEDVERLVLDKSSRRGDEWPVRHPRGGTDRPAGNAVVDRSDASRRESRERFDRPAGSLPYGYVRRKPPGDTPFELTLQRGCGCNRVVLDRYDQRAGREERRDEPVLAGPRVPEVGLEDVGTQPSDLAPEAPDRAYVPFLLSPLERAGHSYLRASRQVDPLPPCRSPRS